MTTFTAPLSPRRIRFVTTALLIVLAGWSAPGRAAQIGAPTIQAAPGSSGAFDLLLTNGPGDSGFNLAGFSAELSLLGASGVSFTSVTIATTAPYVFVTSGTTQPGADPLAPDLTATHFTAVDSEFQSPFYRAVGAGQTYGLARVSYFVDPGAATGVRTLSIGAASDLTDDSLNPIPFSVMNGTFNVVSFSAIPEPSSLALVGVGAILAAAFRVRNGRRPARPSTGASEPA